PQPAPGGPEKKFVVHNLTIRNVHVELSMIGAPGAVGEVINKATNIPVTIDKIELHDVGKTGDGVAGSGVTMSQLSAIIVQAVPPAAAEKAGGLSPADVLGDIQGRLANLGSLKDLGMTVAAPVQKAAEEAVHKAEDAAKKAGDEAKKGIEGV